MEKTSGGGGYRPSRGKLLHVHCGHPSCEGKSAINSLCLIYALLSRIRHCRDFALFGGHFWPKFDGRGHTNILKDRGTAFAILAMFFVKRVKRNQNSV